jgi:NADH dehydrogenase FAD-containing subunit
MPAGWSEHCDASSVIPIKPMQTFLQRLEERMMEVARSRTGPIRVAIVGGGVASVEIAFCLLERNRDQRWSFDCSIAIYTSDDHVAGGMKPNSVRKAERLLSARGIEIIPRQRIAQVTDDCIKASDGQRYPADVVVWATGATAPPILGKLGLQTDERGFIATSSTLQSLSDPRIFAVGDSGTILQSPSPKAGVYAVRQAPILWHNLRAFLDNGRLKPFDPQSDFLKLLNTGDGKALLEYGPFTFHAGWCWHLKTWIDKRFITRFQMPAKVG